MQKNLVYFSLVFLLSACGGSSPAAEKLEPIIPPNAVASNRNKGGVIFTEYSDRLIGHGKSSVLFFYKASDPFSMKNESVIRSVYGTGAAVVTTYRLDFPMSTGARLKYGVVVEDTFVLLDSVGNRVASFIHPSEDEVRIILRGNIPVPQKK